MKLERLLIDTAAALRDDGIRVFGTWLLTNFNPLRPSALTGKCNGTKTAANAHNLFRLARTTLNADICGPGNDSGRADNNTGNANKATDERGIKTSDSHWLGGRIDLDLEIGQWILDSISRKLADLTGKFTGSLFELKIVKEAKRKSLGVHVPIYRWGGGGDWSRAPHQKPADGSIPESNKTGHWTHFDEAGH